MMLNEIQFHPVERLRFCTSLALVERITGLKGGRPAIESLWKMTGTDDERLKMRPVLDSHSRKETGWDCMSSLP